MYFTTNLFKELLRSNHKKDINSIERTLFLLECLDTSSECRRKQDYLEEDQSEGLSNVEFIKSTGVLVQVVQQSRHIVVHLKHSTQC